MGVRLVSIGSVLAICSLSPIHAQELAGWAERVLDFGQATSISASVDVDEVRAVRDDFLPTPTVFARVRSAAEDRGARSRGPNEIRLYSRLSPAVVMVVSAQGQGSGVIVRPDGHVVTNWHVVRGNKEVGVILKPRQEGQAPAMRDLLRARVVRIDEVADLALLKFDAPTPAPVIPMGSTEDIKVGSDVHAIGHPIGETWTYTRGIVSQIRSEYKWTTDSGVVHHARVVQTQTPINPGNSGGPLFSDEGRLVGINSFKSRGEGINFAVSAEDVRRLLNATQDRTGPSAPMARAEGVSCEAKKLFEGRTSKGDADIVVWDTNCDNQADTELVVPLNTKEPILLRIDRNGDRRPDIIVFDHDRDGKWDISWHDVDFDGKWDLIGYHPDGKAVASRFEPYSQSARK